MGISNLVRLHHPFLFYIQPPVVKIRVPQVADSRSCVGVASLAFLDVEF